jgi:hypothetical protein
MDETQEDRAIPRMNGRAIRCRATDALPRIKPFNPQEQRKIAAITRRLELAIGINRDFVPRYVENRKKEVIE